MKIAEAFVELRIDDRKAKAELRTKATSLGGTFASIFGAVAFGAGVRKSIDAASALEQSLGAVEAVLGRNTKAVQRWAEQAAKSMGLSKTAANNALALIVTQLKNYGYTLDEATNKGQDLVGLGADLAATFGGTTADAVNALTAAFRGELDPIERYGVSINEARVKAKALELGLWSGKGALDAHAKAAATMALIYEQSAGAQGQFAREAQTAAGAQQIAAAETENAAASMGDKLLPVYERAVEVIGWLAEGFGALPAPLQYAFLGLVSVVALSGPMRTFKDAIGGVVGALKNMSTSSQVAAGALGAVGAVITVATLAYATYAGEKAKAKAITDRFVEALQAEVKGQKDATKAAIAAEIDTKKMIELSQKYGVSLEDIARFINGEYVPQLDALTKTYGDGGVAMRSGAADVEALTRGMHISSAEAGTLSAEILGLRDNMNAAKEQVAATDTVAEALGLSMDKTADSAGGLAGQFGDLQAAYADLIGELDKRDAYRNALNSLDDLRVAGMEAYAAAVNGADDAEQKQRDYEQAVDDTKRKFTELGASPDIMKSIMVELDQHQYDLVEARLKALEVARTVSFEAVVNGSGQRTSTPRSGMKAFADGGYSDRTQVALLHPDELILPLSNPRRMAALLGSPLAAPVMAMAGTSTTTNGASLSIGQLNVGSRDDLAAARNEIDRLMWRVM